MLRIAVPNKGSLADASIEILKEAGYRQRTDSRDLVLIDSANSVEFYYLRPRDIAVHGVRAPQAARRLKPAVNSAMRAIATLICSSEVA